MGTAGRLTAEVAQAEPEVPGFLPALEAGQTLTFGIRRTTRFLLLGGGVFLIVLGLYTIFFTDCNFSVFSWETALIAGIGLFFIGLGAAGLVLGFCARISGLTLQREGLEIRHWNGQSLPLRWNEVAKVEPCWTGQVRITTPSGRQVVAMDSNFDRSEELLDHLRGVAWFNSFHGAQGADLPLAVREALRAGALRFTPLRLRRASRHGRWRRLAGVLLFSAVTAVLLLQFGRQAGWEEELTLVILCALPFWEAYRLRSFLTGYDALIEVSRKGITARQPNVRETHLTWAQLEDAELEDSRRGVEIVAPAGRIGIGELEHDFFFWDVLGLLHEDLRDEIYGLAAGE